MNNRHTAAEGSFARSAGGAAGRGLILVGLAVIIGIAVMRWGLDGPGDGTVDTSGTTPTTATSDSSTPTSTGSSTPPTDVTGSTVTPPALVPPETVKVVVANGTATKGAAGRFTDTLNGQAYVTLAATNADTATHTESKVYYLPSDPNGAQAAEQVATLLAIPGAPEPMPTPIPLKDPASLGDATVLVVVGADLATATA